MREAVMDIDTDRIDDAVLGLLWLGLHDERASRWLSDKQR
jgi:hypothetical protein